MWPSLVMKTEGVERDKIREVGPQVVGEEVNEKN